ncbi:MAG: hypothetical protein EXQ86_02550 [Rhodospirillales bacterium]|nr:hypothetical protein [Rhodospirillales bacterium]
MIERIMHGGQLLAILVPRRFREPGTQFVTSPESAMQLAVILHPKAKIIQPHVHKPYPREVSETQEVLVITKGRIRVDFYDDAQAYLESRVLEAGDTILLMTGAHGFEVLEDVEMIEAKTGPFLPAEDKTRFAPVSPDRVKFKS